MKKLFCHFPVIILITTKVFSQIQLPPVYESKTDTVLNDTLPNIYWQILEDRSNKLTLAQGMQKLVQERRVALVYRGLSFYNSRRWDWSYDISIGGGSYGNILVTSDSKVHSNVTFNYNFLDYWDVSADETALSPPSGNSVAIKNQNF
jgi:hypothetical protein